MKYLLLAALLVTFSHAETEEEFSARIKIAWESNDVDKVVALYGDPQNLDPDFIRSRRENFLLYKTLRIKSAHIVPFLPPMISQPHIAEGKLAFLPSSSEKCVAIEFFNEDMKSSSWMNIPIIQTKEGIFNFASPQQRLFEWNGPKMNRYSFNLKYKGSDMPCPAIIAVVESCGYTTHRTVGGGGSFGAHKILQLIIPPTFEANAISFEICKDNAEPFFKQTIDTSKGAIIPIESASP